MMNNKNTLLEWLRELGLSGDEAMLYLELLRGPATHLHLARATGVNRTKVYRLAEQLVERSLVAKRSDDRGTFLVAADPTTLEVELVTQEERLKAQRGVFGRLLPALEGILAGQTSSFSVNTYEGADGFKQMLWHELKARGELVVFGSGTLEVLVEDRRWAEKHRARTVEASYRIRELLNPGGKPLEFTANAAFMSGFERRWLAPEVLTLEDQVCIYNDTVAVYHWKEQQKVGLEVASVGYALMMRQMFERYWALGGEASFAGSGVAGAA